MYFKKFPMAKYISTFNKKHYMYMYVHTHLFIACQSVRALVFGSLLQIELYPSVVR